jgi:hypothetical protein
MRIEIKPPSGATPPLRPGALVTLRVEAADPAPRIDGPVSIAYEGRYAPANNPPAFLFPEKDPAPGVSTATSAASDFRTPAATPSSPHVDIPAHEGDTITATLITAPPNAKTYSAALRAPAPGNNPHQPVEMTLVEGGAAPPTPPTPGPAPGLTITPDDPDDPDVLTLDPAPGNDNIVVVG